MKKSLAVFFAAALSGIVLGASDADVLVWYVDTADAEEPAGRNKSFDEIKFWAVAADNTRTGLGGLTYSGPQYLLAGTPATGSGESIATAGDTFAGNYYTDVSSYNDGNYTFLLELYSGGTQVDRMLQGMGLSELTTYMIAKSGLAGDPDKWLEQVTDMDGYNFGQKMVPEPTSGLLLLMGGALLALRRRLK